VNTIRELLRERILYNLLFFALVLIASSLMLSWLTVGHPRRMIVDLGVASINLFGVCMAIFVGISLVSRELDRRTVYVILSKPVPRAHLIIGRYIGLCLVLLLNMGVMIAGFMALLCIANGPLTLPLIQALVTMYFEFTLIAAVAVFFSTVTTSTLSVMCTLAIYICGQSITTLRSVAEKASGYMQTAATSAIYLVPNLEQFNLKGYVLAQHALSASDVGLLIGYASAYSATILGIAIIIFERRDLL
jgi:ABC-type transport system involved in multi-copper enzyme maturation permease subunit